jgi:hypothetical protein
MEQLSEDKAQGKKFGQMSFGEKIVFLGNTLVLWASFGFQYPNIFSE